MKDSYFIMQQVRKCPGVWLGSKSLSALCRFVAGYEYRISTELWMKKTGLDFTEHYDYFLKTYEIGYRSYVNWYEFNQFVHEYYKAVYNTRNAEGLILESTTSEEEAFDKYFELLDAYLEMQNVEQDISGGDTND